MGEQWRHKPKPETRSFCNTGGGNAGKHHKELPLVRKSVAETHQRQSHEITNNRSDRKSSLKLGFDVNQTPNNKVGHHTSSKNRKLKARKKRTRRRSGRSSIQSPQQNTETAYRLRNILWKSLKEPVARKTPQVYLCAGSEDTPPR